MAGLLHISLLIFIQFLLITEAFPQSANATFDREKDLLLLHYDFKTDVDDLHSVAAFATLNAHPDYADIRYHAVAGAYGIQDGLYVPPNELCQLAFGANWSDAHGNRTNALAEVENKVTLTLTRGGDVWIAEGGQSDFSADLVREIRREIPDLRTSARIHVIQHSNWNEKSTSPESLTFVKEHTDYRKIPDGNATGNGTPGFRTEENIPLRSLLSDKETLATWRLAVKLANQYNGKEGRYLNEAVAAGGLDFSDFSEVSWILELENIADATAFFLRFGK